MTEKQKKFNWSLSGLVAVVLLLVGFAAWGNDTSRNAIQARTKAELAEERSIENRTARVILAGRVTQLEERMDTWEKSFDENTQPLIEGIYDAIVGGR